MGGLTWQWAAQDLHPQTDAAVVKPGLRVDADVAGHHGDGQLVEHRNLLFAVSFEYLFMYKGKRRLLQGSVVGDARVAVPPFTKRW